MKTCVDEQLRREAERYSFRFACDDCVHFGGDRCSLGHPPEPRRDAIERGTLDTCKDFDLA